MRKQLALLVGLVVVNATPAHAQLTQAFTPGALNGPLTTHDFEAGPSGAGATYSINNSSPVHAAACSYNQAGCITPSGAFGIGSGNSFSTMTITFANAAGSFGLYFGNDDSCCSGVFTAMLEAYNGAGLIGSVGLVANMDDGADQFVGFNSTVAVDYVNFYYTAQGQNRLALYADDVTFSDAVVATPEPASMTLLATGLIGMFGVARARRKRAA